MKANSLTPNELQNPNQSKEPTCSSQAGAKERRQERKKRRKEERTQSNQSFLYFYTWCHVAETSVEIYKLVNNDREGISDQ